MTSIALRTGSGGIAWTREGLRGGYTAGRNAGREVLMEAAPSAAVAMLLPQRPCDFQTAALDPPAQPRLAQGNPQRRSGCKRGPELRHRVGFAVGRFDELLFTAARTSEVRPVPAREERVDEWLAIRCGCPCADGRNRYFRNSGISGSEPHMQNEPDSNGNWRGR